MAQEKSEEELFKEIKKELRKVKIVLRLEKHGEYIEKKLTPRMVGSLFDLQYMLNDVWDTLKLNKMDKDIAEFFKIIEHIDDAMHRDEIGTYNTKTDKLIWRKKKKDDYLFGKPKWRKIK